MTTKAVEFEAWSVEVGRPGSLMLDSFDGVLLVDQQAAKNHARVAADRFDYVRVVRVRVTVQPIESAPTGDK